MTRIVIGLWCLVCFLFLSLGAVSAQLYLKSNEVKYYADKVSAAETQARTAYTKLYDLQEKKDDEAFNGEAAMQVKLYDRDKALEECKAALAAK